MTSLDFGRRNLWDLVRFSEGVDIHTPVVAQKHEKDKFSLNEYRDKSFMCIQEQYNRRAARSQNGRAISRILEQTLQKKTGYV